MMLDKHVPVNALIAACVNEPIRCKPGVDLVNLKFRPTACNYTGLDSLGSVVVCSSA